MVFGLASRVQVRFVVSGMGMRARFRAYLACSSCGSGTGPKGPMYCYRGYFPKS